MDLLISIVSTLFILFGISLMFSPARGTTVASLIYIGSAVIAFDNQSILPLAIGFALLWLIQ